jgi:hypothetical protein
VYTLKLKKKLTPQLTGSKAQPFMCLCNQLQDPVASVLELLHVGTTSARPKIFKAYNKMFLYTRQKCTAEMNT